MLKRTQLKAYYCTSLVLSMQQVKCIDLKLNGEESGIKDLKSVFEENLNADTEWLRFAFVSRFNQHQRFIYIWTDV